jgi:hypothetical protein
MHRLLAGILLVQHYAAHGWTCGLTRPAAGLERSHHVGTGLVPVGHRVGSALES